MITDANAALGRFGFSGYANSESELLKQMDSCGIDSSLVYSSLSRECDPLGGNLLLLEKIKNHRERLIPCFVMVPEKKLVDVSTDMLVKNDVRAVRIFPATGHFPFRGYALDYMLSFLLKININILMVDFESKAWNDYSAVDWLGVGEISAKYPQLKIVVIGATTAAARIYDKAMSECHNVHIDISQLISPGEIERLVAMGYAERLIMGSGTPFGFPGGIVSLLEKSKLSRTDADKIKGANLRRLLRLEDKKAKSISPAGVPDKYNIIDTHVHHGGWHYASCGRGDADGIAEEMARCAIDKAIVTSLWSCYGEVVEGNRAVAEICRKYPDRIYGYITLDPKFPDEVKDEMDRYSCNPSFRGIKIHTDGHKTRLGDPAYKIIFKYADEHSFPILIHGGESPEFMENLCLKYKNAKFILAHAGGAASVDVKIPSLCSRMNNLFLDLAASKMYCGVLEKLVETAGADKILYGSDYPLFDFAYETGRVKYGNISPEKKKMIFGLNAGKAFNI